MNNKKFSMATRFNDLFKNSKEVQQKRQQHKDNIRKEQLERLMDTHFGGISYEKLLKLAKQHYPDNFI